MSVSTAYSNALPPNTLLLEYRLESVLGAGGFGMTYLAWDANLEKHVAIKEYLPRDLAVRALDNSVVPVNTADHYDYQWGLDRFIEEARTLAKFSHPNIVRVNRFFEAHGTSYMVMDYEAGESLNQFLRRVATLQEAILRAILMPIMEGLLAVHAAGFLHCDIKPSNVFIRKNGSPVLLDFGSARAVAGAPDAIATIVTQGYAPIEQYSSKGNQGPWSDIYALSAVMFRAMTGMNPPDPIARKKMDSVPIALASVRDKYNERFVKAIDWGMSINGKLRPQNIAEWRDVFIGRTPISAVNRGVALGQGGVATILATDINSEEAMTMRVEELTQRVKREPDPPTQKLAPPPPIKKTAQVIKWLVSAGVVMLIWGLGAMWSKHHFDQPEPAASVAVPSGASPAAAGKSNP